MQRENKFYNIYDKRPNLIIVPTVAFSDGPPLKKQKLDEDPGKKAPTPQDVEVGASINTNHSHVTIQKDTKNSVKNSSNNSWASNYLQSIGHSQLSMASKAKKPIVCVPDKGSNLEEVKQDNAGVSSKTENRRPEFEINKKQVNKTEVQLNASEEKSNSLLKNDSFEIQDINKHSLKTFDCVAKKQIDQAGQNKVFPKPVYRIPKKKVIPPNELINNNNSIYKSPSQEKQKTAHEMCLNSQLYHKTENSNQPKNMHTENNQQNPSKAASHNKITFDKHREALTPDGNDLIVPSTENKKSPDIKTDNTNEINDRVKSLLSSILEPDKEQHKNTGIQLNLLKRKPKNTKSNVNKTRENISDARNRAGQTERKNTGPNELSRPKMQVHNLKKNTISPNIAVGFENVKKQSSSNQMHKVLKPLTKRGTKVSHSVNKSSKENKIREVPCFKSKHNLKNGAKIPAKKTSTVKSIHKSKQIASKDVNYSNENSHDRRGRSTLPAKEAKKPTEHHSTVPNVTHDSDNKIEQESPIQNESSKPKVKTIKLIINLICKKPEDKKIEDEAKPKDECQLASVDLSFLDDFNIDDIVDSLNNEDNNGQVQPKKADTESKTTEDICKVTEPNRCLEDEHVIDIRIGSVFNKQVDNKTKQSHDEINGGVIDRLKREKTQQECEKRMNVTTIGIKNDSDNKVEPLASMTTNNNSENKALSSLPLLNHISAEDSETQKINVKHEIEIGANNTKTGLNKPNDFVIDTDKKPCLEGSPSKCFAKKASVESLPQSTFSNAETSKENTASTYAFIDLTESEQNTDSYMPQDSDKCTTLSQSSVFETTKASEHMSKVNSYIDLTGPEECTDPKIQSNNNDNVDNISGKINTPEDSSQPSVSNTMITQISVQEDDDYLSIDLTESEQECLTVSETQDHNSNNTSNFEELKQVTDKENNNSEKQNNNNTNEITAGDVSLSMSDNTCPAENKQATQNDLQTTVTNEKTNDNLKSDSLDKSKATNATCIIHERDSFEKVVEIPPQASNETGIAENTVTISKDPPIIESLKQTLKTRMQEYMGIDCDIGKIIRRGKYSTIFYCKDKNKNEYALKTLHEKQDRYTFGIQKEIMLKALQKDIPKTNQHFVYLVNGFGVEGRWSFLMEYYPKNLRQVLDEKRECFHINDVLKLSRQLISAVIVLRNNNVVHSDIKPEHILMNNSLDRLKLCGFDESRNVEKVILLPNIGTASYRAPELILGHSDGFSIDVWSTALVMFEMATARQLFPGIYNNDILYKQMKTLGKIPFEMVQSSIFKDHHFRGTFFRRRTGYMGKTIILIGFFSKTGISSFVHGAYHRYFGKSRAKYREEDKEKLRSLCDLLHQMLVLDPKNRLPIEFVYANPFVFEAFDGDCLLRC